MSLVSNILKGSNIASGITQAKTSYKPKKSLKSFLKTMDKYGVQVKNNYEINFSGIEDMVMYVSNISLPGIHQNYTELHYDGRLIDVPINYDIDHDFSMTVINDAQGKIYTACYNFIMSDASNAFFNSGYTMTIRALTGDEKHYCGNLITLTGVRFSSVSGLSFGFDENDKSTFEVQCKLTDMKVTGGSALTVKTSKMMGVLNAFLGN